MNPQNHLSVAIESDGIAIATVHTPDRTLNLFTVELVAELGKLIERVAGDATIRGVILTATGKSFIAGADLMEMAQHYEAGISTHAAFELSHATSRLLRRMETCGKPFVAAINGIALGGGFELCLACHYRVLADSPSAVVGLPEVTVGLLPAAGGTQRVPRLIGIEKSLPWLLTGKSSSPAEALKLGLVHAVAPVGELLEVARRWLNSTPEAVQPWDKKGYRMPGGAGLTTPGTLNTFMMSCAQIAKNTFHNYPAPVNVASSVFEGSQVPMDTALRIESRYFARLLRDPVSRNLMRTMFINKGLADKLVQRPEKIPTAQVKTLGVLGAGLMGAGIAHVSAQARMQVVVLDRTQELADKGKAYSRALFDKDIARGRATEQQATEVLARIETTTDYARLADCDLVIEAVFESREIKAEVLARAEAVIGTNAICASNTSTLPISGLAQAVQRPSQFLGIHFFSPVEKMPLVEVIVGKQTSDTTLAHALDYVAQLKKTPIVVNDSRGFYASRVFGTFVFEGMAMLAEGVAPALIENSARMAGMPVGPLAVQDEVSIELQWHVMQQTQQDLGDKYQKPIAYEVVRNFVEELKRSGRRCGKGFYEYPADAPKFLWPGLQDIYPLLAEQPDVQLVKRRLLHIQALEAARCIEEGVVTQAAAVDLGSILGWGFPSYTGGALSYIDTLGLTRFVQECEQLAKQYGARFQPSPWLKARATAGQKFYAEAYVQAKMA